jgi:hypothetical protein
MPAWVMMALCMAGWLGWGWRLKMMVPSLMPRLVRLPRWQKVFWGSGGLFVGLAILMGGLLLIAALGGAKGGIQLWAWPFILILGGIFITIQTLGACALASLILTPETGRKGEASGTPEGNP